jgi:hypothetical protein
VIAAAAIVSASAFAEPGKTADRSEPGPSWDPRPLWQRSTDGHWRAVMNRRPVENEAPAEIVPVVESRPFRIPRAMLPVAQEVAPKVEPIADTIPGKLVASLCSKALNYQAPKSTAAQDREFVASLERVMDVIRRNPAFPPPGFEIKMGCSFERRTDTTGIYQGKITLLFYPYSDKNHYWHGGLEILVNDLGVTGPRANSEDRASDPKVDFPLPSPATYRGLPFLKSEHGVWGGIYLSKRPQDIYNFITYREWIAANLPRLETEYRERKAAAEASPTVRNQVTKRNFQSLYERILLTSQRMPAAELDTPVWLADLGPSDAANMDAARQARLNVPGYFNRKLAPQAIQLINILPMHTKYNHLHAVLEKLDYGVLMSLIQ